MFQLEDQKEIVKSIILFEEPQANMGMELSVNQAIFWEPSNKGFYATFSKVGFFCFFFVFITFNWYKISIRDLAYKTKGGELNILLLVCPSPLNAAPKTSRGPLASLELSTVYVVWMYRIHSVVWSPRTAGKGCFFPSCLGFIDKNRFLFPEWKSPIHRFTLAELAFWVKAVRGANVNSSKRWGCKE